LPTRPARYNRAHDRARLAAFRALPLYSPCARCGRLMFKWGKDERGRSTLHYDHRDTGTGYLGFSHARCNTAGGQDQPSTSTVAVDAATPGRHRTWPRMVRTGIPPFVRDTCSDCALPKKSLPGSHGSVYVPASCGVSEQFSLI
jgi:hypothetical protein